MSRRLWATQCETSPANSDIRSQTKLTTSVVDYQRTWQESAPHFNPGDALFLVTAAADTQPEIAERQLQAKRVTSALAPLKAFTKTRQPLIAAQHLMLWCNRSIESSKRSDVSNF
jgi:hypothetical protein